MTTHLLMIALAAAIAAATGAAWAAFGQRRRGDRLAERLRSVKETAGQGASLARAADEEAARRARLTTEVRRSAASGKFYWVLRLDGRTVATRQASPHERREAAEEEAAAVAPQGGLAA